jgi:metal-dependent amidase/aminoacylase/carboxypeptidase family protein
MPRKIVSVQSTVIPLEWDKEKGFNQWALQIRNELHNPEKGFEAYQTIAEVNKILKFHKPTKP